MELVLVKVLCLCAVFVCMVIAAFLPFRLVASSDNKRQQRFLSFSNCVAGGVFLGTCFIGLTPTVKAKFTSVLHSAPDTDIPIAEFTIMMGYFLMLFMEQLAHACNPDKKPDGQDTSDSFEMKSRSDTPSESVNGGNLDRHDSDDDEECEIYSREAHPLSEMDNHHGHSHQSSHGAGHGHSHTGFVKGGSSLRRFMLLLALSVHSLFEGSALGLQETITKTLHLFIAILLHELLVAFAFGVSLAKMELKPKSYIQMIVFFCLMIPVGVGLGIAVGRMPGFGGELASAIMQGLAAGTFIYVVFVEILPNELDGGQDNIWRILCVFIGFTIFSCLQFVTILT